MSNKIMEKAIGNLDDDLIAQAANCKQRRGKIISFYTLGAIAACLILIIAISFVLPHKKTPEILVNGETLSDTVTLTSNTNAYMRAADNTSLSAELEIKLHGKTRISVSEGSLSVSSGERTTSYGSEGFDSDKDTSLKWIILSPDETKTYKLMLDGETYAEVSFDKGRNVWVMTGQ